MIGPKESLQYLLESALQAHLTCNPPGEVECETCGNYPPDISYSMNYDYM